MKKIFTICCLLAASQSFAQTGDVGIGTVSPKAQLHTTGTVRFDTLRGTGVRPVYVNDSGNLIIGNPNAVSTYTPAAIPDGDCAGASSPITVTGMPTAVPSSNIQVRINISHTYDGDLDIYLISPAGQILNLAFANGGSSDNYINTVFSDAGTQVLPSTGAPYTGTYKPVGSTAAVGNIAAISGNSTCAYTGNVTTFAGFGATVVPNGTWTLKVIDRTYVDVGTINNWAILFDGGFFSAPSIPANYVPKGTSAGLLTSSSIYDNGNVGIGTTTPNAPLQFSNSVVSRKIVLYETANNNNQFIGFGINGSILRYQTDVTGSDHVFYAGTSATASNELMRIRGTGNVGIGASSPAELLQIGSSTGAAYASPGLLLQSSANTDGQGGVIKFRETGGNYGINLRHNSNPNTAGTNVEGLFIEGYNNGTSSNIMTVDQNGLNVGIRTVKPVAALDVQGTFSVGETAFPGGLAFSMRQDANNYVGRIANFSNSGSASNGLRIDAGDNIVPSGGFSGYFPAIMAFFRPDGTNIGGVAQTSSASVSYFTTSDMRLKRDITASHYSLADLLKIQVRDYRYNDDESAQTGFLAQQLYTIFPNAVSKGGDDPKTHPWMVDYGRVTPLIIKAMQDMNEEIESLKKENADLKAQAAQITEMAKQIKALQEAEGIGSKTTKAPGN